MNYNWNWRIFWEMSPDGVGTYMDTLWSGLVWTLATAGAAWIMALILGLVMAFDGRPEAFGSTAAILGHPLRSLVAAARETSVLFAVLIGGWFLREPLRLRTWMAAVCVVAGLGLLRLAH